MPITGEATDASVSAWSISCYEVENEALGRSSKTHGLEHTLCEGCLDGPTLFRVVRGGLHRLLRCIQSLSYNFDLCGSLSIHAFIQILWILNWQKAQMKHLAERILGHD